MEAPPTLLIIYVPHIINRRTVLPPSPMALVSNPVIRILAIHDPTELLLVLAKPCRRPAFILGRMPVCRHHNSGLGRLAGVQRRKPRIHPPPLNRFVDRLTVIVIMIRCTRREVAGGSVGGRCPRCRRRRWTNQVNRLPVAGHSPPPLLRCWLLFRLHN